MKYGMHVLLLTIVGLLSGIISYSVTDHTVSGIGFSPIPFYEPGVVFGLVICLYFWSISKQKLLNSILFIILSAGSYYAAAMIAFYITVFGFLVTMPIGLLLGGFVGTWLFLKAFKLLIHPVDKARSQMIIALGTILSLVYMVFYFNPAISQSNDTFDFPLFFLLLTWQVSVAFTLARATFPIAQDVREKPTMPYFILAALIIFSIMLFPQR